MERCITGLELIARNLFMDLSLPWQESEPVRRKYDADSAVEACIGDAKLQYYIIEARHLAFRNQKRKISVMSFQGNIKLHYSAPLTDYDAFKTWLNQRKPFGAFLADKHPYFWPFEPLMMEACVRLDSYRGVREFFTDLLASQYVAQK